MLCDETPDAGEPGPHERARAVLLVDREAQGGAAGRERVAFALRGVQLIAQCLDLPLQCRDPLLGGLVRAVERAVAVLARGRPGLERDEFGARAVATLLGLLEGAALALQFPVRARESRSGHLDVRGEPGELEVVAGDESGLRGDLLIEGVERCLRGRELARGSTEGLLGLGDPRGEPLGLVPGLLHRGLAYGRAHRRSVALLAQQGESLVGEGVQAPQALLRGLEPEGDAAGDVDGVADLGLLEAAFAQLGLVELLLQHDALGLALRLAAADVGDGGAQLDDLVREQAGAGIACDRGDRGRLLGDLGLLAEGLELAADLAGKVAQTGEVRLHRLELAERLLLAPPVLEDAGRLLDEPAPVLGTRVQHRVELALPDDHVHLAAETGVAQQLLHVEQAALLAVDRVLAAAVAEQRATDRDLAVLDRQRAIGVVDRQQHLGAAERALGRRCRRR